jgi:hypothetical protein
LYAIFFRLAKIEFASWFVPVQRRIELILLVSETIELTIFACATIELAF